jgi:hypothetical protein
LKDLILARQLSGGGIQGVRRFQFTGAAVGIDINNIKPYIQFHG